MSKILLILVLLGATSICFSQVSVDAQIEAIQNAPAQQRVKLMNAFKRQLLKMNQEERRAAISAMRSQMANKSHTSSQMQMQEMQMQSSQRVYQMQNMNQSQMKSIMKKGSYMETPRNDSPMSNRFPRDRQ